MDITPRTPVADPTARMWRPAPCTSVKDPRHKRHPENTTGKTKFDEIRPQYWTDDGWQVPGVKVYGTSTTGGTIVSINAYERVRDGLVDRYEKITIVHDQLLPPSGVECWASCRGAYRSTWFSCGCPCGGASHGEKNWLLNYRLVTETPVPSWIPGYTAKRSTFVYTEDGAAA